MACPIFMSLQPKENELHSPQQGAEQNDEQVRNPMYYEEGQGRDYGYLSYDPDDDDIRRREVMLLFSDKTIRAAFIRKVYSILTVQLVLTALIVVLFYSVHELRMYILLNSWIAMAAMAASLIILLILTCCQTIAQTAPINYIFLFIYTIIEGIALSVICIRVSPEVVLIALGITLGIVFLLTVFAFQTSIDFTGLGMILYIALSVLVMVGVFMVLVQPSKPFQIIFSAAGALLFCVFLVYDTQLMMGGTHQYAIMPEDYIYAVLSLYLDIINLFSDILRLLVLGGVGR